jgi:Tfp pilus assembly protein PilN
VNGGAVNLARRPFANTRPLRRVATALWLVGGALAAVVAVLYWRALFGIEGRRTEIAAVDRAIAEERRRLAAGEAALAGLDLRRQNVEAAYLEARIRERTFPWSALFEDLAEVLPRKVRIASLSPKAGGPLSDPDAARSRRPGSAVSFGRVHLQLTGAAANDEALIELIDRLFASRRFANPTMPTERRDNDGTIGFALGVSYLPPSREAGGGPAPKKSAPATVVEDDGGTAAATEGTP